MSRKVAVATVSHRPSTADPHEVICTARRFCRRAALQGAQMICFPEIYPQAADAGQPCRTAETVPGRTTEAMLETSRTEGLWIVWPLYTREGDIVRNSSLILSPDGSIAGAYHKMFPTIGEMDAGVTPGTEATVFSLPWGRAGCAICFDMNFPEVREGLRDGGAEIVFFSSAYRGTHQAQAWAYDLGSYVVTSVLGELSQIVDLSGYVLAEATYEGLVVRTLNLERELFHMDYNWEKMDEMLERYGSGISFDYFTREAVFAIGCEAEGITVETLRKEFGLERRQDYYARSRRVRAEALGKLGG